MSTAVTANVTEKMGEIMHDENALDLVNTPARESSQKFEEDDLLEALDTLEFPRLPLQFKWALWGAMSKDTYEPSKLGEFDDVKTMLQFLNNVRLPSSMAVCQYMMFKDGVHPKWEDPRCAKGGRWVMRLENKKFRNQPSMIDEIWDALCIGMCGEHMGSDLDTKVLDKVLGLHYAGRKETRRLSLWLETDVMEEIMAIGQAFKSFILTEGLVKSDGQSLDEGDLPDMHFELFSTANKGFAVIKKNIEIRRGGGKGRQGERGRTEN